MTQDLVIIGAAGVGRQCIDIIERMVEAGTGDYSIRGVFDDQPKPEDLDKLSDRAVPFLGTIDDLLALNETLAVILGVGYPAPRGKILARLLAGEFIYPSIIDPRACLGTCVRIGQGVVVASGADISTHSIIGDFAHVNPSAILGHDVSLDKNVTVSPGATVSGNVTVGDSALVGAASVILQQLSVGEKAVIGAGAVVTRSVPPHTTVKGNPAK